MNVKRLASATGVVARTGLVATAIFQLALGNAFAQAAVSRDNDTATPIKHVIVIIGENRSFDHVFATYVPPKQGETVSNLLSKGIIQADGTPGPNFPQAEQKAATDVAPDAFLLSPATNSFQGSVLPAPLNGGPTESVIKDNSLELARQSENGLPAAYYAYLTTGGTGLTGKIPDTRITNVNALPPGPFQLTNALRSPTTRTPPARCTASTRCGSSWIAASHHATRHQSLRLRCKHCSPGSRSPSARAPTAMAQPANFSTEYAPTPSPPAKAPPPWASTTCRTGDAPYFKMPRRHYSMSDNFHQAVNGRHGRQPHHARPRRRDLLQRRQGQCRQQPPHNVR